MDPNRPVTACVHFESPHSVAFRLFQQVPGGEEAELATGSSMDQNPSCHSGGPFPVGTIIRWVFLIAGNPNTAYRMRITLEQDGQPIINPVPVSGTTASDGRADEFGEVTLCARASRSARPRPPRSPPPCRPRRRSRTPSRNRPPSPS